MIQARPTSTIVLVDYTEETAKFLKVILTSKQYDVMVCSTGNQALQKLQELENPLALITSQRVPGEGSMNGLELIRRAREYHKDLPVMLITGGHDDNVITAINGMTRAVYIKKPFIPAEILDALRVLVGHRKGPSGPGSAR